MKKLSFQLLVVIFSMIASFILCFSLSGRNFEPLDFSIFSTIGTLLGFLIIESNFESPEGL